MTDNSVDSTHSSAGTCSHGVSLALHCAQCAVKPIPTNLPPPQNPDTVAQWDRGVARDFSDITDRLRFPESPEELSKAQDEGAAEIDQLRAVLQSTLCQLNSEKVFPALQKKIRQVLGIEEGKVSHAVKPTAEQFKVGDYVQVGPPECETFGTIVHIGSNRAGVQYDHGPKREPLLSILRHAQK